MPKPDTVSSKYEAAAIYHRSHCNVPLVTSQKGYINNKQNMLIPLAYICYS